MKALGVCEDEDGYVCVHVFFLYVCVCVCMDVRVVCMCVCKDVCVCVCVVVHPVHVYFLRCKLSLGGKPLIIQTYTWDNSSYGNGKKYIGSAFPATP